MRTIRLCDNILCCAIKELSALFRDRLSHRDSDRTTTEISVFTKRVDDGSSQPEITANTPLRLADAVKIAFPMGGMTVAGLRRERDRDRLVIEKIAGKEFTRWLTLNGCESYAATKQRR